MDEKIEKEKWIYVERIMQPIISTIKGKYLLQTITLKKNEERF